jgi:predicted permease
VIKHAFRTIAAMPVLATVVVISLGIGIGVNTAVFSWVEALMLKPLPAVRDSAGLYIVETKANSGTFPGVSWREYDDFHDRLKAFQGLLAYRMAPLAIGESGRTERAYSMMVSGNYFSVLELKPALGRLIEPNDATQAGSQPVVVISYDYWQTRYGGKHDVIGQSIRANEHPLQIIGVAPEFFQGTVTSLQMDLYVPATMAPELFAGSRELEDRTSRGYNVMGRLKDGTSQAQAQTEMSTAMQELAVAFPASNAEMTGVVSTFMESPRGPQRMFASALGALQVLMLFVLLAVCGNTANLVLARASTRQKEIGVRLALGAGPGRVIRALLVENIVLALMGSAVGIAIAMWGTEALRAMPAYGAFPVKIQTSVDWIGLLFAIGLGLLSGLLFGLAPALHLARIDAQQALRSGSKSSGRSAIREALMGLQVALALLVLVVAGLFFRSFVETRGADPGFRVDGVVLGTYDLSGRGFDDDRLREFARRLLERVRGIPGVEGAAISSNVPLDLHGLPLVSFALEGRAVVADKPDQALGNIVTPGYFTTLSIPFVAGKDFADLADPSAPPQVIVNDEFVRRFLNGGEPIGRQLNSRDKTFVIAGVVKTSTYETFGEPPTPAMYYSFRDRPRIVGEVHLRARPGTESVLGSALQAAVREIDPTLPVYNVRTMSEHIDKNLYLRKIPARMFLVVAPILLALIAIGIFAVVAYAVSQRTSEIGVRLALGATSDRVVRQIVMESMNAIVFGAACGWLLALMIDLHLFSGGMQDAPVMAGVPALLMVVALVSCWIPARRAAMVDPVRSLRQE